MAVRHKCFLSYHKADKKAVDDFAEEFEGIFIRRGQVMTDSIIESTDTDYVMRRIRELYLLDSTVTIVLIGQCTWARRFVDWEVQASLRRAASGPDPNGLLAINLWKSYDTLPNRVKLNFDSGYAEHHAYPPGPITLGNWVEAAFSARSAKANLIQNPRARFKYNRQCP